MDKKLAGLFAFIGFGVFVASWLWRVLMDRPALPVEDLIVYGILVFWVYFIIGIGIARIGVSLVQEVLADKRIREEEKRIQARNLYREQIGEEPETPGASAETPPPAEQETA